MTEAVAMRVGGYSGRENKRNIAFLKIKEWILNGELPSGTILVERQLCELLNLSRTPVRSALQDLVKDGFVIAAPGRGLMVSSVQIDDAVEIFEIRQVVEVLALELFMKGDHPGVVARMRRTVEDMQEAMKREDYQTFIRADNLFHELYSENTGNRRLKKICTELSEQAQRFTALTVDDSVRCQMSYQHHTAIMESIEAGDIQKATELLRKHLMDSMEYHIRKMTRI